MKAVHLVTTDEFLELARLDSFWQRPDPVEAFGFVLAQSPSQVSKELFMLCGQRGLAPCITLLDVPLIYDERRYIKQLYVWQYGGSNQQKVEPTRVPTSIK
eukprot:1434306-Pyramimonas_sp.AAC.1